MTKEEAIYKAKHLRKVHPSICIDAEDFWETVIAALEQEPCDDAISRQAVLEIIRDFEYKNSHEEMLINSRIKQLPSVTPAEKVGRWIPVSERLPKEDNEVLITIKSCGKLYVCHSVYRDGLFWQKNFEFNSYRNPIAWMPLPEPYKSEVDE